MSAASFPTTPGLTTFRSKGAFVEGTYTIDDKLAAGVRYDWFHPDISKTNTQWAVTPYVSMPMNNGFQVIGEYQHRDLQLDSTHHRTNDSVQVRVIFIQ